jgi:hypothetical protein
VICRFADLGAAGGGGGDEGEGNSSARLYSTSDVIHFRPHPSPTSHPSPLVRPFSPRIRNT